MNQFYTEFDRETYPEFRKSRDGDGRTPFQIDRDRIIFSPAFRRLQSKTQVFRSGEYDFYRTRLTHSLEVAQIGRSICDHLRRLGKPLSPDFFVDPDLVEACCLAHDMGHPPFGHAGEAALHESMVKYGGFEGNAQTLRVLTDRFFDETGTPSGMVPTRALLDGVLKYKKVFAADTKRKFLYPEQQAVLDFVQFGDRSIECQIMDWADDVAYGLMDIVDGVNAQFVNMDALERWKMALGRELSETETVWWNKLRDSILKGTVERTFAMKIGDCISATSLVEGEDPSKGATNRHRFRLAIEQKFLDQVGFYKKLAVELIFLTPQIRQLEFKGRQMLKTFFRCLLEHYKNPKAGGPGLIPSNLEILLNRQSDEAGRMRVLCDYVAGLTDASLIRTYRRLFDPESGSITDL